MSSDKIGLIVGDGKFPVLVARAAKEQGLKVVVAGFEGRVDPELKHAVETLELFPFCLVGAILEFLKKQQISQTVIIGTIPPSVVHNTELQFDDVALKIWQQAKARRTDSMMGSIVELLQDNGINVLDSTTYLKDHLAPQKVMTQRKPEEKELEDINLGFRVARVIGGFDIGQTVVVKNGTILAVEAVEGTDKAITRTTDLASPGAVVVKVAKPDQDMRFDVPAVGTPTIKAMIRSGARVLAIEAGKVLMEDPQAMIELADENDLAILGVREPENQ